MKILAWYTIIIMGFVQLYVLGDMIDGTDEAYVNLMIMAMYAPPIVLAVKALKK